MTIHETDASGASGLTGAGSPGLTTKTAEHTPGPYTYRQYQSCFRIYGPPRDGTPRGIATIQFPDQDADTAVGEANARLFTAAPLGLALAEHILALIDDAYFQGHPEWEPLVAEAHALKAKAEGRAEK